MTKCCDDMGISNVEFLRQFNLRALADRVPVLGGIDLTRRCNLRCVHCYLGEHRDDNGYNAELSTSQIRKIIDEVVDAGCLYFLFTGGEPLLRQDFPELYRYARSKGLLVTVFTNGTLIDEKVAGLFREVPPRRVEISLYGATAATYDRITGRPGSYAKCRRGIDMLVDAGVPLELKTVVMTLNSHEIGALEAIADAYGVKFRLDAALFPAFDGSRIPLSLRVPVEDAVAKDLSNPQRLRMRREFMRGASETDVSGDRLFNCGAGMSAFHINAEGELLPCLMTTTARYDLVSGNFAEGWRDVIPAIREQRLGDDSPCRGCTDRPACDYCPPFFALENGREDQPSEYLCEMARERVKYIIGKKGS